MQTNLSPEFRSTAEGSEAEAILRKCVHCGFCTATCPTYQLLGDELDGPRGRIYLIKQVLEGAEPTRATQLHLDRCLTCRNCESTCPSGVQYGNLVEIGRRIVDARVERPATERAARQMLKEGLTSPLFAPALRAGQLVRGFLPSSLRNKVPPRAPLHAHCWPTRAHARKVLMLTGCVQPAMMPNINSATARVLDAAGIQAVVADGAGCCGAIRLHLNDHDGGLSDMRRNIDAWWPLVARGEVEAIVMNASGCGVTVREYGHALAHDAAYADKARRIGELTKDLSELLTDLVPALKPLLRGRALGFDIRAASSESHLCCGSAGTYSVLQPELAYKLRDRKLQNLAQIEPHAIVSANIGCIQHLQSGTSTPVRHWVELLDDALAAAPAS
jgi:glycolate oxidase iron-sulfur subunit